MKLAFIILIFHINMCFLLGQVWFPQYNDSTKIIDLAIGGNKKTTVNNVNSSQSFQIRIVNKMPTKNYTISIKIIDYSVDPLFLPKGSNPLLSMPTNDTPPQTKKRNQDSAFCNQINSNIKELYDVKSEKELTGKILQLSNNLILIPNPKDTTRECVADVYKLALGVLNSTTHSLGSFNLKEDQILEIDIEREEGMHWNFTYTTFTKKGTWRTLYGVNSTFVGWPVSSKKYYLSESGTGSDKKYIITGKRNNHLNLSPTILFTYINNSKLNSNWINSWAAGIGYNNTSPILFFGRQSTYHENLCISFGINILTMDHLNPINSEGQEFLNLISEDQLLIKKYIPALTLGIHFRFGNNILNGQE